MLGRIAAVIGAGLLGTAVATAPAAPAAAAVTPSLTATIALSNCSAALVATPPRSTPTGP